MASGYDKMVLTLKLNEILGEDILRRREWSGVDWKEDSTRVLDYACGTGMISQVRLLPDLTKSVRTYEWKGDRYSLRTRNR